MADKKRQLPDKIVNADGSPTLDFRLWADDLLYGTGADSIGTLLSGQNTTNTRVTGIIAGTVAIDPLIEDRGRLSEELDATNANIASTATSASAGALSASISPAYAYASTSGGASGTTNSVTVTAAGGTAPYTYAWAKKSGDTVTVNGPTAAATTFTGAAGVGGFLSAVYTCTVTDSAGSPATFTVDVNVTINDFT